MHTSMKSPTGCALWRNPEPLVTGVLEQSFERLERFVQDDHWSRSLLRCRECGQLYFFEFYEEVDWADGDDPQYCTWIPVETSLRAAGRLELRRLAPRLCEDWPKGGEQRVYWVRDGEAPEPPTPAPAAAAATTTPGLGRKATVATLELLGPLAALILLPAGTLGYWQGWLLWAHVAAWSAGLLLWCLRHDPALLERRLESGPQAEREPAQKLIMALVALLVAALFLVPALDQRFGWSAVPWAVVLLGHLLVAAGFGVVFLVFRVNSFAASTVAVSPEQTVVSRGPYALLRHPMYAGSVLLFAGVPLALGSWWGLAALVPTLAALVARLLAEERFLAEKLPGYRDYLARVRFRLIPGLW